MNLIEYCFSLDDQQKFKTAIIDQNGKKISFEQFKNKVQLISGHLNSLGVSKGDRVFLLVPMSIDLYILIASIFQLGATVVFIDPWATKEYVKNALEQADVDYLFYDIKALPLMMLHPSIRVIRELFTTDQIFKEAKSKRLRRQDITPVKQEDTALITFTTGSTGKPKGCNRTHGFLQAQHLAHERYYFHRQDDIDLVMFPVFTLSNLASKMTTVLIKGNLRKIKSSSPDSIVNQMLEQNVTSFTFSPSLAFLIAKDLLAKGQTIIGIKKIFVGGAPLPNGLFELLKSVFPSAEIYLVYGSSEAEPIAMLPADIAITQSIQYTMHGKGIPLGVVVDEVQIKILDLNSDPQLLVETNSKKSGEITISGSFVGKKYISEDLGQTKIEDPLGAIWHRTGDIGYLEDGFLFMTGRINAKLYYGDQILFPLELEPLLDQINGIEKSAVFQSNLEKKELGVLIQASNITSAQADYIRNQCEQIFHTKGLSLAKIHLVKEIPLDKRHNSKIDYQEIYQMYNEESVNKLKAQSYLKRILSYTNERFPLLSILLFVLLFTFDSFYLMQQALFGKTGPFFSAQILVGFITIFLTFFHVRLFDEFKDYTDDCIAHPERLLSRGVVTLKDLGALLISCILLELFLNVGLGLDQLISCLIIIGYSILMFKEFFIKEYLKSNMLLYLISHQILLPIMIVYCALTATNQPVSDILTTPVALAAILFITLLSFGYEIARKTWSADREHPQADSYTKTWGIVTSIAVIIVTNFAILVLSSYINQKLNFNHAGNIVSIIIFSIVSYLALQFATNPTNKNSKMVELGGIIALLGNHLNMIIMSILN